MLSKRIPKPDDDIDLGDLFRERRAAQAKKRHENMLSSTAKLVEAGLHFTSHNEGVHLIVLDAWDFWPSTGKFMERKGRAGKPRRFGRGVFRLLRIIEEDSRAASV